MMRSNVIFLGVNSLYRSRKFWILFGIVFLISDLSTSRGVRAETPKNRHVEFSWEKVSGATQYEIEVARDPNFKNPIEKKSNSNLDNPKESFELEPGQYYYHVRGVDKLGVPGNWGASAAITVNAAPPRLVFPKSGGTISEKTIRGIGFKWTPGLVGTLYSFELYPQGSETAELSKSGFDQPEFYWRPIKSGVYRWRAGYFTPHGSEWSRFHEFNVAESAVPHDSDTISQLKWNTEKPVLATDWQDTDRAPYVSWQGTYFREDTPLLYLGKNLAAEPKHKFRLEIPVVDGKVKIEFMAILPTGETEKQIWEFSFPEVQKLLAEREESKKKRFFLVPGLGYTLISYRETDRPSVTETALTGKVTATYLIPKIPISLMGNIYMNLVPITRDSDITIRFLGLNGRAAYFFSLGKEWGLSLYGGYFHTMMFISRSDMGFSDMAGPQFYPSVTRVLSNGGILSGYAKVAFISGAQSPMQIANNEIAGGLSYTRPFRAKNSWGLYLDASSLSVNAQGVKVLSRTLTLGGTFGF